MKKFEVTLRQDAVINWVATVEAYSKEDAAAMVLAQWNGEENGVELLRDGAYGYDNADCEEDDCEEIEDAKSAPATLTNPCNEITDPSPQCLGRRAR